MAISFPLTPYIGEIYSLITGESWVWTGSAWESLSGNCVGPEGPTGATGSTGPTGSGFTTIYNTGDNRVITSNGTTDSANAESNLNFDGNTLQVLSGSATGSVLNVGEISSGKPIFSVGNEKYTKTQSLIIDSVSTNTEIFSIADTKGGAAFYEYYVYNESSSYRSGTIMAVWDSTSEEVKYTETSTPDLNGSTSGISFSLYITSNNVILRADVSSGNWSIRLGVRLI